MATPASTLTEQLKGAMSAFGFIHRQDLVDAGWSSERIRAAVRSSGALVARRQWILAPRADAAVIRAAEAGGRVTCQTAARLRGLWIPDGDDTMHLAVDPHSSSCFAGEAVTPHRARPIVPVSRRDLIDPIENILAAVATCLPYESARVIWESAVRERRVTLDHLARVKGWPRRARRLVGEATDLSHSGLETTVATRLARIGVRMRQQVWIEGHHVDGLIGDRLVIQIDGYRHHKDAAQRRSDIAHDRALRLLGYTVLRYDYAEITFAWPRVQAEILAAMAQGLHLA
jgi:very-short-patch-repair endonuclease